MKFQVKAVSATGLRLRIPGSELFIPLLTGGIMGDSFSCNGFLYVYDLSCPPESKSCTL